MIHRSESELTLDQIVFGNRNKAYGAFQLREIYNRNLIRALIIVLFVFSTALVTPKIISYFFPNQHIAIVNCPAVLLPTDLTEVFKVIYPSKPQPQLTSTKPSVAEKIPTKIVKDVLVANPVKVIDPTLSQVEGVINNDPNKVVLVPNPSGGAIINNTATDQPDKIFSWVGEKQIFKEGELLKFLSNEVKYPTLAINQEVMGRVIVEFIIEKDGSVSHVKTLKGIGSGCDEEAERVIKLTSGLWTPGKNNGEPVRLKVVQTIFFKLP